jgi:hypothetical protein
LERSRNKVIVRERAVGIRIDFFGYTIKVLLIIFKF